MLKSRPGMASIEMLFVFATFVIATFAFVRLGMAIIQVFFGDGNQAIAIPLF